MSLPTALGKNRFLTSRCLPTIVIIMVSLIQYYFLEMIPTVVSSEILDFLSSPATLTISSVVLLAFLYLFSEIIREVGKLIQHLLYGKRGCTFPQCQWLLNPRICPLSASTIRKVKQKIKEDFGISVISRTKRRNSTEQQLKEISDVMAQIHELTLDHELLSAERIDYTFRRNLSAGFLILLVFQLCLCFIYGEGKQFFGPYGFSPIVRFFTHDRSSRLLLRIPTFNGVLGDQEVEINPPRFVFFMKLGGLEGSSN